MTDDEMSQYLQEGQTAFQCSMLAPLVKSAETEEAALITAGFLGAFEVFLVERFGSELAKKILEQSQHRLARLINTETKAKIIFN